MSRLAKWGSNKYIIYAMHVLFWMLLILPFFSGAYNSQFFEHMKYRMLFNNSFLIFLFYFNAFYLYPKFYKKKGWGLYVFAVVLSIIILLSVSRYLESRFLPTPSMMTNRPFPPKGPGPGGFFPLPIFIFIVGISFSYRLLLEQNKEEKKRKEQETETLKTELNFLRSQISPHFMFNVLNTLVLLARKKSDLIEPSLIRLSTLMRYVLNESNYSRIPLQKEVEYLQNYIDLQMLRFGDDLNLQLDISSQLEGYEIEPMLLIPFVENAFKHGIGTLEYPRISIGLQIENHRLFFKVENEMAPSGDRKDPDSGIGLRNVRRRLELLYKDQHELRTVIDHGIFYAELQIGLR